MTVRRRLTPIQKARRLVRNQIAAMKRARCATRKQLHLPPKKYWRLVRYLAAHNCS